MGEYPASPYFFIMREQIQNNIHKIIESHNNIALEWATGVGKSRAAITLANSIIDKGYKHILLIVAETPHKNNWKEEFSKWQLKECNLTIECYASLKKYKDTNWDMIIFDEAHHLNSDLRISILETIKSKYIILLSATLPGQLMDNSLLGKLSSIYGNFITSKITLQQAIENNILPEPKILLIPLNLDTTPNTETIVEEWGDKNKRITFKCTYSQRWGILKNKKRFPNVSLTITCSQLQKYEYYTEQYEFWKKRYMLTRNERIKNLWLQAGSKRKLYLGECKTKIAQILINKLKNKRFICFCTNIAQADILNANNSIHSKKNNSLEIIDNFNKKKINSLFAVGMLQEGQNLNDIQAGIIIQLDNAERAFIQKFGRSLRAESPVQYILYYKNTRDEEYLEKNVLEEINKDFINYIRLEDI